MLITDVQPSQTERNCDTHNAPEARKLRSKVMLFIFYMTIVSKITISDAKEFYEIHAVKTCFIFKLCFKILVLDVYEHS